MPIRVMIVDDSNFMRKALSLLITSAPGFEIAGMISNGEEAVRSVPVLKPDVVTLDLEMGGMDGVATLKKMMGTNPVPVVMVSAHTRRGAEATMKSLQEGAVDFIEKPSGPLSVDLASVRDELIAKLRTASKVKVGRPSSASRVRETDKTLRLKHPEGSVIAIGSSTGGVQALQAIIPRLPKYFPLPVVVVQHMPPMFTKTLAESLGAASKLKVKEGEEGDLLQPGHVYIAPGGLHMTVRADKEKDKKVIHVDKMPDNTILRPCADVLFGSVAEHYGENAMGVILTGMGNDGTEGLKTMKARGAKVIAQDEATCSVYGMPRAAVEAGVVDIVLPVNDIAQQIEKMVI